MAAMPIRLEPDATTTTPVSGSSGMLTATNITVPVSGDGVTTEHVWVTWNVQYSNSAASTSVSAISSINNTTFTTTDAIWASWNVTRYEWRDPSAEEIVRLRAERAESERKKMLADARARKLLMSFLDDAQRAQYEKNQYFEVVTRGAKGVRRYRLTHGWAGNVFLLDERGRQVERLCIHPSKSVPHADNLLAQKLLLEADEDRFLKIANKTRLIAV